MKLELILFDKGNVVKDGKYLVRTESTGFGTVQFLQARVKKVWHEKKQIFEMTVDVTNQTVTHISAQPLNFEK